MNNKGIIGSVIFVGILVVVGFFWFVGEGENEEVERGSCVPASCCHADSCAWESEAPNCNATLCTMSCEPGTMDCEEGHCGVVEGECEVIWNE